MDEISQKSHKKLDDVTIKEHTDKERVNEEFI